MLSRMEDTGGTRTVKLARRSPGSPTTVRPGSRGSSRFTSEHGERQSGRRNSEIQVNEGQQLVGSIGITEVLQEDDRPTFIIDTENSGLESDGLDVVYTNPALRRQPGLLEHVCGTSSDPTQLLQIEFDFTSFKAWALGKPTNGAVDQLKTCVYAGFDWAYSDVRKRLRIFRGRYVPEQLPETAMKRQHFQPYKPSPNNTPQSDTVSPGYFGVNPAASSRRAATSGTLEALVHTHDLTERVSEEADEIPVSPLTNGDTSMGELITNALSPSSEQRTLPAPNSVEGFDSLHASHFSENGFFDWTRLPI